MALATRPKPKTHHKKRQAQHHRHSKHYVKAYWPYLPMLMIIGLGLFINALWSQAGVLGIKSDFSSVTLLNETNKRRAAAGQPALSLDPQLTAAAQTKAEDMVKTDYWSHTAPDGKTPWTFIKASGYQYQTAGENLAYGFASAGETITGWMNSTEHRANILNTSYRNVGFGIANSPNYQGNGPETVVVAEYGQPVAAAATIAFTVPETDANTPATDVSGAAAELPAQPVARIQLLTGGQAAWSLVAISALAGAALALFITRHGVRLHRALTRGEAFITHHPWFDIAMVFITTAGILLSRTGGLIR